MPRTRPSSPPSLLGHLIILSVVLVTMIFLYGAIDYRAEAFVSWDLAGYRLMAQASPGLTADVIRPLVYRLLGPYIVGLLPIPDPLGFQWLSYLTASTLIFGTYTLFRALHIHPTAALLAVILYMFNKWFFGVFTWDYFQIGDLLGLLQLIVLYWALRSYNWPVFASVFLLSALTRETCLILIPVACTYLAERRADRRTVAVFAGAILPGLVLLVLMRIYTPYQGGLSLVEAFAVYFPAKVQSLDAWYRIVINALGPIAFVPLIFARETRAFLRTNMHLIVWYFVTIGSTFFGSNTERLMAPAFVVVYLVIAVIIQQRLLSHRLLLGVFMIAASFGSMSYEINARYPLPSSIVSRSVTLGALAAVTMLALIIRTRGNATTATSVDAPLGTR